MIRVKFTNSYTIVSDICCHFIELIALNAIKHIILDLYNTVIIIIAGIY